MKISELYNFGPSSKYRETVFEAIDESGQESQEIREEFESLQITNPRVFFTGRPSFRYIYDTARQKLLPHSFALPETYKMSANAYFINLGEWLVVKTQRVESFKSFVDEINNDTNHLYFIYAIVKAPPKYPDHEKLRTFVRYQKKKLSVNIKKHKIPMEKRYKVVAINSGTEVNNENYNEDDARSLIKDLNNDAEELGFPELKYKAVLVGEENLQGELK